MTRRYATEVPTRQVLVGAALAVLLAAAVVGLARWLVLPSELEPELGAGLEANNPQAGAEGACVPPGADPVPLRVTSALLLACSVELDGALVTYEGEVVESVLFRGERALVTMNDDPYGGEAGPLPDHRTQLGGNAGVTVSLPAKASAGITTLGSYRAQGDRLAVVGTFRRADPTLGGAPAITAERVALAVPGRPIPHDAEPRRVAVAALLAAATLVMLFTHRRRIRRPRRA